MSSHVISGGIDCYVGNQSRRLSQRFWNQDIENEYIAFQFAKDLIKEFDRLKRVHCETRGLG